jgi:hypothetical protein
MQRPVAGQRRSCVGFKTAKGAHPARPLFGRERHPPNNPAIAPMTITNAIQNGRMVVIYGEGGKFLFSHNGELHDHGSAHVTVRQGLWLYVYDPHGRCIGSVPAQKTPP